MQITRRGFLAGTAAAALGAMVPIPERLPVPAELEELRRAKRLIAMTGWEVNIHARTMTYCCGAVPTRVVVGQDIDICSRFTVHKNLQWTLCRRLHDSLGEYGTVRLTRQEGVTWSATAVLQRVELDLMPACDPETGRRSPDWMTLRLELAGVDAPTTTLEPSPHVLAGAPHQLWLLEEVARAERREGLLRALSDS